MKTTLRAMLTVSIFLSIALVAYPIDTPETFTMDSLSQRYEPVEFSHGYHAEMIGDCTMCHHHSEEGTTPACGECHEPITVYHYEGTERETSIGLKGAYHQQCMGCHEEWGSGPVGCTDCHARKE
jgi:uncharacterized paraquat-inducible protein A